MVEVEEPRVNGPHIRPLGDGTLLAERFVQYAHDRPAINSDADLERHVLDVTAEESLGAVDRVYPDCNVLHGEFAQKQVGIQIGQGSIFLKEV